MLGGIARWIAGLCGLLVAFGIFGLLIGGADELFNLGIFNNDYPVLTEDEATGSKPVPGTFGEYAKQTAIIVGICAVIGSVLWWFFGDEL
jgi:hypothetical protein